MQLDAAKAADDFVISRIKQRIADLGTTMQAASLRAGLEADFIQTIVARKKTPRNLIGLRKVAGALRCTVAYLIGETDQPGDPTPDLQVGVLNEVVSVTIVHKSGHVQTFRQ